MSSSPSDGTTTAGSSGQLWLPASRSFRVLQACNVCRRRKTKCNGVHPTCGSCILRRLPCSWPTHHLASTPPADDTSVPQPTVLNSEESARKRPRLSRIKRSDGGGCRPPDLLQHALDIFYTRHHSIEFCSFFHIPSLDVASLHRQSPFLEHALLALSGLYFSGVDAATEGFETPAAFSEWHAAVARQHSRESVDSPSIRSIQANLILALRDLLARLPHKAWSFTGIAIRQAQTLRLGREYHSRASNGQKETQRRTYWACFIMDRLVSYCCWRPQTIDFDCVYLNLPCPENVFTFEEPFDGPKLDTLPLPCEVSRFGLLPYFIAALHLWAQAVYIQEKGGRRHSNHRPDDPQPSFRQLDQRINHFHDSIPTVMQWSIQNCKTFRHAGQEALFVNFHFLLNHTRCVLYQEYLPYRDVTSAGDQESTEIPLDNRDERIVSVCVASSEAIVDMVSELFTAGTTTNGPRSVFAAAAILSAANIQLWLQHVEASDDETRKQIAANVSKLATVLESWIAQWPVAATWTSTLASLHQVYEATYDSSPNVQDIDHGQELLEAVSDAPPEPARDDGNDRPPSRLTEGKGLPELKDQMVDKIRFILLASLEDPDAKARVLKASISKIGHKAQNNATSPASFDFWLPSDMNFGFPDLYLDDSWSGINDAHSDDNIVNHGIDFDPDDHRY